MIARVETHCAQLRTHSICVDGNVRACINCDWYEQYFRHNRGNIRMEIGVSTGYCLAHQKQRGPLRQPCRDFRQTQSN